MAAELESKLGCTVRLIKGGRGIFDVTADGKLVFSKHSVGRFPAAGEVSDILQA